MHQRSETQNHKPQLIPLIYKNLYFKAFFNCSFWSQYDVHHVDAFISSNSTFNDTLILFLISEAWISLTIKPCMDTKQKSNETTWKVFWPQRSRHKIGRCSKCAFKVGKVEILLYFYLIYETTSNRLKNGNTNSF